jgi:hypothetical protein
LLENDPEEQEEEQEGQGNDIGDTRKIVLHPRENRKEHDKGK